MPVKSIDYIVTAKHYAKRRDCGSVKDWVLKMRAEIHQQHGAAITIKDIDKPAGAPVYARIWQGSWIADCDVCNGAIFVDPGEPFFFCFGCANRANDHRPRPVIFPEEREEIERLILERPVNDTAGLDDLDRAGMSRAVLGVEVDGDVKPLTRSWRPGETAKDLKAQQSDAIKKWKSKSKKVKHGL